MENKLVKMTRSNPNVAIPLEHQNKIKSTMDGHGIRRAHVIIGISRHSMERAAGGLTVNRGTAALIKIYCESGK